MRCEICIDHEVCMKSLGRGAYHGWSLFKNYLRAVSNIEFTELAPPEVVLEASLPSRIPH